MADWVALLRGINVGTAKRIAMADLRRVVGELGFTDVATLLNSGNVVFAESAASGSASSPASVSGSASGTGPDPGRLREAVRASTGVDAELVVLSAARFRALAEANPLRRDDREPKRLAVAFAGKPIDVGAAREAAPSPADLGEEELLIDEWAVYQWLPNGVTNSVVPLSFWRSLGTPVTARNDATVLKIVALLESRA